MSAVLQYESRGISEFRVFHGDGDFREPMGGRLTVPLRCNRPCARRAGIVALFSEHPGDGVHDIGLAQPLGPTMQVVPEPLKVTMVRSQKRFEGRRFRLSEALSKVSPLCP